MNSLRFVSGKGNHINDSKCTEIKTFRVTLLLFGAEFGFLKNQIALCGFIYISDECDGILTKI